MIVSAKLWDLPTQQSHEDGERVIANLSVDLKPGAKEKLRRAINKFLKIKANILFVNRTRNRIWIERAAGYQEITKNVEHSCDPSSGLGTMVFRIHPVDLSGACRLCVWQKRRNNPFLQSIRAWAGYGIEIQAVWEEE